MNVKRLESRLRGAASLDLEALQLAAAEIADGMVEPSAAELKRVREVLALARVEGEAAAYRDALDDVLAAFTKGLARKENLDAARSAAEQHRDLVAELVAGPRTPKELSARLKRDFSLVSRNLGELGKAGIVEVLGGSRDGRERPRQLTLRGQDLAHQLGIAPGSIPRHVERSLDCATAVLSSVVVEKTVSVERLVKVAERSLAGLEVSPEAAVEHVVTQAEEHGLLRRDEDLACIDEAFELGAEIRHRITESVRRGAGDSGFWDQVTSATGGDPKVDIVVRAANPSRDRWNAFFAFLSKEPRGRVLGAADLEMRLIDASGPYILIYESLALLKSDLCQVEGVRAVASSAKRCFFLSSNGASEAGAARPAPPLEPAVLPPDGDPDTVFRLFHPLEIRLDHEAA